MTERKYYTAPKYGERVVFVRGCIKFYGIFVGWDDFENLMVRLSDGTNKTFKVFAGEVVEVTSL